MFCLGTLLDMSSPLISFLQYIKSDDDVRSTRKGKAPGSRSSEDSMDSTTSSLENEKFEKRKENRTSRYVNQERKRIE
jgi:hypothetical protein